MLQMRRNDVLLSHLIQLGNVKMYFCFLSIVSIEMEKESDILPDRGQGPYPA